MKNTIKKDLRTNKFGRTKNSRNITLSITDDIRKEMEQYSEVNWSAVVREGIQTYIAKRKQNKETAK